MIHRVGDIYAHADRLHVVLAADRDRLLSAPILHESQPVMRHDVPLYELTDLAACGLPGGWYTIRVAMMVQWPMRRLAAVGRVPDRLMLAVLAAAKRETMDRQMEARYREAEVA